MNVGFNLQRGARMDWWRPYTSTSSMVVNQSSGPQNRRDSTYGIACMIELTLLYIRCFITTCEDEETARFWAGVMAAVSQGYRGDMAIIDRVCKWGYFSQRK